MEEIIDHYNDIASSKIANNFIDALEHGVGHIASYPKTGSSLFAHELSLVGLKSWKLKGFPDRVFYVEKDDNIDVWRVLYIHSNIPKWLKEQ